MKTVLTLLLSFGLGSTLLANDDLATMLLLNEEGTPLCHFSEKIRLDEWSESPLGGEDLALNEEFPLCEKEDIEESLFETDISLGMVASPMARFNPSILMWKAFKVGAMAGSALGCAVGIRAGSLGRDIGKNMDDIGNVGKIAGSIPGFLSGLWFYFKTAVMSPYPIATFNGIIIVFGITKTSELSGDYSSILCGLVTEVVVK